MEMKVRGQILRHLMARRLWRWPASAAAVFCAAAGISLLRHHFASVSTVAVCAIVAVVATSGLSREKRLLASWSDDAVAYQRWLNERYAESNGQARGIAVLSVILAAFLALLAVSSLAPIPALSRPPAWLLLGCLCLLAGVIGSHRYVSQRRKRLHSLLENLNDV